MTYTVEQLLTLDSKVFGTLKPKQLNEIMETLKTERKERNKKYITPLTKQHIKPVQDKFIKPVKDEHIKPIDKVVKELKTYMPKKKAPKAYITINGQRYGPLTKKEFVEMITEVEEEDEQEQ